RVGGAGAAQGRDGRVADRRDDPRAQRTAAGVETIGAVPELEERVLDYVLGSAGISQNAQRHRVSQLAVAVVELCQSPDMSSSKRLSELEIVFKLHQANGHASEYVVRRSLEYLSD